MRYLLVVVCAVLVTFPLCAMAVPSVQQSDAAAAPVQSLTFAAESFGLDLRGLWLETARVRPGQTLAGLLQPHGVSMAAVYQAARASEGLFDVRRIRSGKPYRVALDPREGCRLKYLVYEKTPVDFVVFDFSAIPRVSLGQKTLQTKIRQASGTITSSVWNAFVEQGLSPDLLLQLADIFACTVDFRQLQPGDSFQILFAEKWVEGRAVAVGNIRAALLTTRHKSYQAFRFSRGESSAYYDEAGNSLQKAFLKSPLRYSRISSGFTKKRLHPVTKVYRSHPGIDYAAPRGTPVRSIGDGIIRRIGYSKSAGKTIAIDHPGPYASEYLHLSAFKKGLRRNSRVSKEQVIGYVGSTGLATGPHLDFRFKKNGCYRDYRRVELPAGEAVVPELMAAFIKQVQLYLARLATDSQGEVIAAAPKPATAGGQLKLQQSTHLPVRQ